MINNSGFLGVVTLKSLGGVLSQWFSLFVNKSPMSNLFFAAFSIIGDFFYATTLLHVIEPN